MKIPIEPCSLPAPCRDCVACGGSPVMSNTTQNSTQIRDCPPVPNATCDCPTCPEDCGCPEKGRYDHSKLCHVVQFFNDGFGHQLEAMISMLASHEYHNVYYDGWWTARKRTWGFHHLGATDAKIAKKYLQSAVQEFSQEMEMDLSTIKRGFYSERAPYRPGIEGRKEAYEHFAFLYGECDPKKRYPVNNFHFCHYTRALQVEKKLALRKYFVDNNAHLPKDRLNHDYLNVVIHIRLGNSPERSIPFFNVSQIINKTLECYPNEAVRFRVHSDGNVSKIAEALQVDPKAVVDYFPRSTPILVVFRDFVEADILVMSHSSLCQAAHWFGRRYRAVIARDDHFRDTILCRFRLDVVTTVSEFLELNVTTAPR